MIESLRRLGIDVRHDAQRCTAEVVGCGGRLPASEAELFVANSGTTIRFAQDDFLFVDADNHKFDTRGYRIAGTGTIGPRGQVGPVSGVDLKVVAAYRAGATHFLCPTENLAEARAVGLPLEIMEAESLPRVVKTLDALAPKS